MQENKSGCFFSEHSVHGFVIWSHCCRKQWWVLSNMNYCFSNISVSVNAHCCLFTDTMFPTPRRSAQLLTLTTTTQLAMLEAQSGTVALLLMLNVRTWKSVPEIPSQCLAVVVEWVWALTAVIAVRKMNLIGQYHSERESVNLAPHCQTGRGRVRWHQAEWSADIPFRMGFNFCGFYDACMPLPYTGKPFLIFDHKMWKFSMLIVVTCILLSHYRLLISYTWTAFLDSDYFLDLLCLSVCFIFLPLFLLVSDPVW